MSAKVKVRYTFRYVSRCGGEVEMDQSEFDNWNKDVKARGLDDEDLAMEMLDEIGHGGRHSWIDECEIEQFSVVT